MALVRNVHRDGKPFRMGDTEARVVISPEVTGPFWRCGPASQAAGSPAA